ncbi:MAG: KpsF/GutQ family sugar-phosphate isomerase [Bacteroidetes bacterium]|nr:KpsF/GutQ family sugar-phosphate isomerase [Bacteroidota bacterium]
MKTINEIKKSANTAIQIELDTISKLQNYIDDTFAECIRLIGESKGRVIVTGVGKSAIIAQKIVSSFNSTGTPAIFMHAADAIHGDLGNIREKDIVLCLSKSGSSPEIKVLIPLIRNLGLDTKIIAMVSVTNSFLSQNSDYTIYAMIDREACPNNLAPTSSTTAQIVMGDAMMVSLLEYSGFTTQDYALTHPGGALGKKLYLRVSDLYKNNERPFVYTNDKLDKIIIEISSKRLGATAVLNEKDQLVGIITDGDLRRMLEKTKNFEQITAKDIMSPSPKTIEEDILAVDAYSTMKKNKITSLLVMNDHEYLGVVHIHDILREGIV